MAVRIDPDAARLSLGREIGDVGELAGIGCHGEQGDLVGGALGRIEEFAIGCDLDVGGPDFRLVVFRRRRCARRRSTYRRLRRAQASPASAGTELMLSTRVNVPLPASIAYCVTCPDSSLST